jgi:hypothetical protein
VTTRTRFAILAVIVTLGCGVAGVGYIANRMTHRGEGPRRTYPLAGDEVLTDEQAIALAKQTLQLDGRFSEAMTLETFGDGSAVNRGDDKSYVSLSWWDPTRGRWYVQLHRTPERVDAVSYPGK